MDRDKTGEILPSCLKTPIIDATSQLRVQGMDGAWCYCAHPLRRPGCPGDHPNFLCLECGRRICLEGQSLPYVTMSDWFQVDEKQLVLYGICPCQRKTPVLQQKKPH